MIGPPTNADPYITGILLSVAGGNCILPPPAAPDVDDFICRLAINRDTPVANNDVPINLAVPTTTALSVSAFTAVTTAVAAAENNAML
jgi:hypothetical protein